MLHLNTNTPQTGSTVKLLSNQELQDNWFAHTWQESPSKTVVFHYEGAVFIGFENCITGKRFGVALPISDAERLARSLVGHAHVATSKNEV